MVSKCKGYNLLDKQAKSGKNSEMMVRLPFSAVDRKRMPVFKFNGRMLDAEFGKES